MGGSVSLKRTPCPMNAFTLRAVNGADRVAVTSKMESNVKEIIVAVITDSARGDGQFESGDERFTSAAVYETCRINLEKGTKREGVDFECPNFSVYTFTRNRCTCTGTHRHT